MSSLNVTIYSIKGKLFTGKADTVVVPGYNGDIGVIAGDRILTYILKPGIIYLMKDEKTFKRLFIFNGRFICSYNELNITTEYEVFDLDNIKVEDIEKRIRDIKVKINNSTNDIDKNYYEQCLHKENILFSAYKENYY